MNELGFVSHKQDNSRQAESSTTNSNFLPCSGADWPDQQKITFKTENTKTFEHTKMKQNKQTKDDNNKKYSGTFSWNGYLKMCKYR